MIEWRGPSPFYFAPLPKEMAGEVAYAARLASYGRGVVPVTADIAGRRFTTSLFPRDGGYLLPLKDAVRRPLGLVPGDPVTVALALYPPTAATK